MFHKAYERLEGAPPLDGRAVSPYAIGLDPERFEQDGLFGGEGLTLEQAMERAEGIQTIWLDRFVRA